MLEEKHTIPSFHTNAQIADMNSRVAVIVTHPWGPLGGDMHNNVVVAAVLYFHSIGITTCRFDFAGSQVGRGNAQVTQVQQAASYLLQGKHIPSSNTNNKPPSYILLCGYSYGSLIVASASSLIPQCIGCISIAPPISVQHWLLCFHGKFHANQARQRTSLPRLYILGSRDNFTTEPAFREWVSSFPRETTTGAVLKGADHFFHKREADCMAIIATWLVSTYPACRGHLENFGNLEFPTLVPRKSTTTTNNADATTTTTTTTSPNAASSLCGFNLGPVL